MDTKNNRISKIFLAIIFLPFFIAGCIQPITLGLLESGKNSAVHEFYIDNYKMKVRIIPIADDYKYICSFSLVNKNDGTPIKDLKSLMDIKKYPSYPQKHNRHRHEKQKLMSGLEPSYDSTAINYEYKYIFKSKGKYELTIKLSEIEGTPLAKDIYIFYDQEVK